MPLRAGIGMPAYGKFGSTEYRIFKILLWLVINKLTVCS